MNAITTFLSLPKPSRREVADENSIKMNTGLELSCFPPHLPYHQVELIARFHYSAKQVHRNSLNYKRRTINKSNWSQAYVKEPTVASLWTASKGSSPPNQNQTQAYGANQYTTTDGTL
ncbi:unnamed protein product [Spodoptera exigua]|nr:unnamed protein product [Spodoptera exigua]